jgi:hypothetical protein
MVQTQNTGKAGNDFGHKMGMYAANHLGTELLNNVNGSNEAMLDGQRVVIKSAHLGNNRIGIPHNVLNRVVGVIAVIEDRNSPIDKKHKYSIYKIDSEWFKSKMIPDCRRDNIGHVSNGKIRQYGRRISELTCDF